MARLRPIVRSAEAVGVAASSDRLAARAASCSVPASRGITRSRMRGTCSDLRKANLPRLLEVEPELCRGVEVAGEAQRGVGGDARGRR